MCRMRVVLGVGVAHADDVAELALARIWVHAAAAVAQNEVDLHHHGSSMIQVRGILVRMGQWPEGDQDHRHTHVLLIAHASPMFRPLNGSVYSQPQTPPRPYF